ncbi:vasodilator-stimulated phosphoprotein-like [Brachypodium distachyon]|uniref:vasodilator-stimulated phosphoprotein-like n=1 Tax=Brachypodium distachyon TaxID=15368 RepID=UPI00071C6CA1|nr:vasodilator-stimulated phosphoprotein-like [Brachypodium distachyon]|eukprot:XP_014753740.1 vasodilator-stimulated phosphoprotein-like [Brachypodium distachyon]
MVIHYMYTSDGRALLGTTLWPEPARGREQTLHPPRLARSRSPGPVPVPTRPARGPPTPPLRPPPTPSQRRRSPQQPAGDSPAAEAGTEGDKPPPTSTATPQGPDAPTTGADDTVIHLTSDAEDGALRDEPEVAPTPSPAARDTMVVAPTVATGVGLDGASPAPPAGGADRSAGGDSCRGRGPPPDPQPTGARVEEDVAGEQQAAPLQGDDAPPGQTMAAGVSSSSVATSSPNLGILAGATCDPITWNPSIYDQGHQFLDAIKEQQLAFVTSFNKVREHHELVKGQLGEVRRDVERERQELSRLREETHLARLARDEAATPVIPEAELQRQLEAQRTEHQQLLDSLAAAREKANKEHEEVLATAQARLNEKSEQVSSYSSQIQVLRTKLESKPWPRRTQQRRRRCERRSSIPPRKRAPISSPNCPSPGVSSSRWARTM